MGILQLFHLDPDLKFVYPDIHCPYESMVKYHEPVEHLVLTNGELLCFSGVVGVVFDTPSDAIYSHKLLEEFDLLIVSNDERYKACELVDNFNQYEHVRQEYCSSNVSCTSMVDLESWDVILGLAVVILILFFMMLYWHGTNH